MFLDSPSSELCVDTAKEVPKEKLPPLIETKPAAVPARTESDSNNNKKQGVNDYDAVTIISPSNEQSIRNNEGQVIISYQSSPALKSRNGHRFVVMMGGTEVYRGTNTSVSLENVDRGTHVVKTKIVAANGRTLASSDSVEFTLHRHSRLHNTNQVIRPVPLPN